MTPVTTRHIDVVDHDYPPWKARRSRRLPVNGAATYSRDIVAHHVGHWDALVGGQRTLLSTAPPLLDYPDDHYDLTIQYLHTFPQRRQLDLPTRIADRFKRTVFVTAYLPYQRLLDRAGFEAVWVPMKVDTDWVRHLAGRLPGPDPQPRRAVYYGNVTRSKQQTLYRLRRMFSLHGWRLDVVSGSRQAEALRRVKTYDYGVGVGRCALEMMSLGLRVMVAGREFGGIVASGHDFHAQTSVNFNTRVTTFDSELESCLESWPSVPSDWREAVDVSTAIPVIRAWTG